MKDPNRLLDDIRIASPCKASWDAMTGTDSVRFCGECRLNVYNISNMTSADAAALVERAEGRLCVRLFKRTDGTVLTRNCPVGLRATLARASRAAGAALTMILGLLSGVAARAAWSSAPQDRTAACPFPGSEDPPPVIMGKIAAPRGQVSIRVTDASHGFSLSNARVTLTDERTGDVFEPEAGEDGQYHFPYVRPGVFVLNVSVDGYDVAKPRRVRVREGRPVRLEVALTGGRVLMGDVALPAPEPAPEPFMQVDEPGK
jgi:hypothetical protein